MKQRFRATALSLGLATAATLAIAAGSHKGGHDADEASVGEAGRTANVTRTVYVDMNDAMRFNPLDLTVRQGETIRFVLKNSGQVKHEMVLGTPTELKEHYAMMMKMPGMEHAEPNQLVVAPGQTGELIWRFTKAGKIEFACLQPGHYDAGMKGAVHVEATGLPVVSSRKVSV